MTPQKRKAFSEQTIRNLGLSINEYLPLIETEDETMLRSTDEVLQRLIALWAVAGTAMLQGNTYFREYIIENQLQKWLSKRELEFLLLEKPNQNQIVQFSWQIESLYFIAWCAGLIPQIQIPSQESTIKEIVKFFPQEKEAPILLKSSIQLRTKTELLDQADLLYRLHWSVRNNILNNTTQPAVIGGVVQEWHRAVNWMINYDQENNWDYIATDT